MKNSDELLREMKEMTTDERIAYLQRERPDLFDSRIRTIGFGKAPKDGWKESDRVAK